MKRSKKWLTMLLIFTLAATSGLVAGNQEVKAADKLTPAAGKLPGQSNPLITHKYGADPYAMEYNGRLYLYLTDDQAQWELTPDTNNSYANARSITIISSSDMVNWTDHGRVPVGKQVGGTAWANNAWAPAIAWKNIDGKDKFFLYFADNASGIGVLVGDSPIGPFHDPLGKPLIDRSVPNVTTTGVPWLFDPAVLVDDDGKAYLYFGGGITGLDANNPKSSRVVQLDDDMISIVGTPQEIDAPRIFEDSGIHKINGKYYYSYCSNFSGNDGPGYPPTGTIAYMVSDSPMGPFEYIGPILPGPHVFGNGDAGNNHHAIFQFKDKWYITYHTRQVNIAQRLINGQNGHRDYRSPSITELEIDPDTGRITPLQMENKGVGQLEALNPYSRVEAETIAWNGGISTEPTTQPGAMVESINLQVTDINDGDWIAAADVDFGDKGAGTFTVNVASGSKGGIIELRLDQADGELIGTLPVPSTGGWDQWKTLTTSISGAAGAHNLYMVFRGEETGRLFNLDYWQFHEKSDRNDLVAINASIDKQKIDIASGSNTANITVKAIYADGTSEDVTAKASAVPEQEGIVNISGGVVTGVNYGSTNINISYEGKTYGIYVEVKNLKAELTVKKLIVDNNKPVLDLGSTESFKVTAEYEDGHTEDVTALADYSNSNPDVAEVSNGKITAKRSGTTSVIVSFKGAMGHNVTAQIYVSVSNVSAPLKFIIKNSDPQFEGPAKVVYGDVIGFFDKGTDGNKDGAVTFTVNVPTAGKYKMSVYNVVHWGEVPHQYTINGDTSNTIQYKYPSAPTGWKLSPFTPDLTLNAGENTIRIAYDPAATGAAELQYIELQAYNGDNSFVPIEGVSLDKSEIALEAGDSDTLTATVNPDTASDKNVTFIVEGSAVTVTESVYDVIEGTTSVWIKAEEPGSAIVKAYAGGFAAETVVTVEGGEVPQPEIIKVTGVTLDKEALTLEVNKSTQLKAAVTPANATNKKVTWSSSDEGIATVDQEGNVKGIKAGTATIRVTTEDGGFTAESAVTVQNPSGGSNPGNGGGSGGSNPGSGGSSGGGSTGGGSGNSGAVKPAVPNEEQKPTEEPKAPETSPQPPALPKFTDLTNHWASKEIEKLASKNIISGYPDGSFKPNQEINRAEFVTLVCRLLQLESTAGGSAFKDVKSDAWYAGCVGAVKEAGIVGGYQDGTFKPNQKITREEVFVIIYKMAKDKLNASGNQQAFIDDAAVSSWAKEAVNALVKAGVVSGYEDGSIKPKNSITRAEVAKLLAYFAQ
ncbi:S-layer homology domain-containing protein [Paenibacillus sp. Marseille-P2973]|uniref:S-layer homology domain-containing protein n=1 Tax=Paenibacillus sp. Marseille-P2973 TaxID=1871032 RepID=UPI001B38F768|nr:S-layer homology domain-containing protein [Paenibacillus sp. Marseille-P2973]MBQ4900750.1 S-layer homology domain-containing protein [Paenibacillus sp. Marseille-P2973]